MIAPIVAGSKSSWTSRHGRNAQLVQVRLAEAGLGVDPLRRRAPQPMPSIAPRQLLKALTRHLGVVNGIFDEFGIDRAFEIRELTLVLNAQIFRQAAQAVRRAGQGRGQRPGVQKVTGLKTRLHPSPSMAAGGFLVGWLRKPEERLSAVTMLDAQEGLIVEGG